MCCEPGLSNHEVKRLVVVFTWNMNYYQPEGLFRGRGKEAINALQKCKLVALGIRVPGLGLRV